MPALYIADGHHRAASAARARQHLRQGGATGEWDTFLAVAFPGDQTQILPYNRVVKDLGSYTPDVVPGGAARAVQRQAGPGDAGAQGRGGDVPGRRVAHALR